MADTTRNQSKSDPQPATRGRIGLLAAMAIGIGGMVGAGIFSILGVVAQAAGAALWLSFMVGGVVALPSTYSYAKLGLRYPSAGGAVEFLVQGFGDGVLSGGINFHMWIGYVIALAQAAKPFLGVWGFKLVAVAALFSTASAINATHLRVIAATGAKNWVVWLSLLTCLAMFGVLSVYIYQNSKMALSTMLALLPLCFALEWAYRLQTGRALKTRT